MPPNEPSRTRKSSSSAIEAPYDRTSTLQGRIDAHRGLVTLLDHPASIVLDPDSRLTQLGLVPVCPDSSYFFFDSRAYGAATSASLGTLAAQWATETLGVAEARAYIAPTPTDAAPRVTVSFGVGENPAKRVSEAFEIEVLQHLVRLGAKILVDQGAGGEEAERVKHAVRQTAGLPGQVEMFSGPFATFAAHIARSPLYVGYDSAGQHAAAALRIPSITVFAGYPNQRFLERWKPTGPASQVYLADAPNLMNEIFRTMAKYLAKP
jgi:Glycosyltransferase family 9 (heptosyltransferase)